jgi:hypothetical protein
MADFINYLIYESNLYTTSVDDPIKYIVRIWKTASSIINDAFLLIKLVLDNYVY